MACPSCQFPNDEGFHFCQLCGYKRLVRPVDTTSTVVLDLAGIDNKLKELDMKLSDSAYERQKSALEMSLKTFLMSLTPPRDLLSATPLDIRRFLVFKDKGGKTKVHAFDCIFLGEGGKQDCMCPFRLSSGTVDSLIGKLRSIFSNNGRSGDWDVKLGYGNPAASPEVKRYLKAVKEKQARALVRPQQAKPIFAGDKLVKLSRHIEQN